MNEIDINLELTSREKKLIELIRSMEFGEINIIVQNSEPIRVEELKRSIKL